MSTPTFSSIIASSTASRASTYIPPFATATSAGGNSPASGSTTSSLLPNPTTPSYQDDVTWVQAYLTIHSLSKNSYVYMYIFWFAVFLVFVALSIATWTGVRGGALGARWQKWALRRRTWRKKATIKKAEAEARRRGLDPSLAHKQPRALPSNAQILSATTLVIVVLALCFVGPDYINPDLNLFDFSGAKTSSSSLTRRSQIQISDQILNDFIPHYTISKSLWSMAARTGGFAFALFPLVIVLALKAAPFALFAIPGLVGYSHDKMIRLHRYVGRLVWFVTFLHVVFWVVQVSKDKRANTGKLIITYVWQYYRFRFAWVAFLSMTILMIFTFDCIRNPHYEIFYTVHVVFTPLTIIFSALHHPARSLWYWCFAALALWIGERLWRFCWWVYVNDSFNLGTKKSGIKNGRNTSDTGIVRPYSYAAIKPADKEAPQFQTPHRLTPSGSSVATLTDALGGMSNERQKQEEFELGSIRSPAPLRPQSGNLVDFGNSRPASVTSSVYSDHVEPTPSPGELIGLARVGSGQGDSTTNLRGVPLQIQTGGNGVTTPIPTYPPVTHLHQWHVAAPVPTQTPGAGPGPQTSINQISKSPATYFQPQPARPPVPTYAPPPGYALATLLPGRTVRLRLVTPGYQTWAPGQHFLVKIPAISKITTHPFSVAGVCDEQAALRVEQGNESGVSPRAQVEAGRELVLLIRAKKGWTKRLWDLVSTLQGQSRSQPDGERLPPGYSPPPVGTPGVILRSMVDGPFGSAARTRWGRYSSVLIVAGGSGVSFGMSVLEYICLCIAGRDGKFLGGHPGGWGVGKKGSWVTQRVRFVWLVREYAHIQWCAGALSRCLTIVPTDALEINIFVTNFRPSKEPKGFLPVSPGGVESPESRHPEADDDGLLKPPAPRFAQNGNKRDRRHSSTSVDSSASDISVDSIVDSYFEDSEGGKGDEMGELGFESHALDYTNFDGDDDTPMPGENRLSRRIIKESRLRRKRTQKVEKAVAAKRELEARAQQNRTSHSRDDSYDQISLSQEPLLGNTQTQADTQITPSLLSPPLSPGSPHSSLTAFSATDRPGKHQSFNSFSALSPDTGGGKRLSVVSQASSADIKSPSALSPSTSTPSLTTAAGSWTEPTIRWSEPNIDRDGVARPEVSLALEPQDVRDLQVVSEWARPGKPKLGRILSDEVEASKGRVAVACCGPTSLNALMRKLIAERINPTRVAHGDLRGSIDFIAEDFEY